MQHDNRVAYVRGKDLDGVGEPMIINRRVKREIFQNFLFRQMHERTDEIIIARIDKDVAARFNKFCKLRYNAFLSLFRIFAAAATDTGK